MTSRLGALVAAVAFGIVALVANAQAPSPPRTVVHVLAFDGGWNLPIWVAQRNGLFEAQGLDVQLAYTPSSGFLVKSVLEGKADLAFAAIDNVIAYQEGQGEADVPANPDLFAFMGGDGGFISIVAAPPVAAVKDLKGRTVSVDAMTTGFAFVVRELVARSGLAEADVSFVRAGGTANRYRDLVAGKHDATLLRTPFELLAENRGYHVIAGAESLGPYQGTVGLARRSFADAHEATLVAFLRAYKAATDWLYDPANREVAEALLVAHIRDMTPALAKRSYALLVSPKGGLSRDLKPDAAGIATVLALRDKYATPHKTLTDPMKYVDLRYYEKAFAK
ncbi:MAG TPA: ABC transporter substrate-binding protein [Casimicrobiaceae bacterium]|jgi:ABC-type nitrate/sulfonate/bicarbonate transport system substrate-binding protein|nr:ABC transporter substrate-binding protein [Casimicrobiaceae bacterium]